MRKMVLIPLEEWEKVRRDRTPPFKMLDIPQRDEKIHQKLRRQENRNEDLQRNQKHPKLETKPREEKEGRRRKVSITPVGAQQNPTMRRKNQSLPTMTQMSHQGAGEMGSKGIRLNQFAPAIRNRARKLIDLLKKAKKVGFNSLYELSVSGIVVPQSNIIHLIEHALGKNKSNELVGIHRFYTLLRNIGVPLSLIVNEWGRKQMLKKSRKGPGSSL